MKTLAIAAGVIAVGGLGNVLADIHTPFNVATSNVKGSCDSVGDDKLNTMLSEMEAFSTAAGDGLAGLIQRTAQDESLAWSFLQLFDLNLVSWLREKKGLSKAEKQFLTATMGPFISEVGDVANDGQFGWSLYCDASRLVYTENMYVDGEKTDKPLSDAPNLNGATKGYWDTIHQTYVLDKDPSEAGPCSETASKTWAFTNHASKSITICPQAFGDPIIQSIASLKANQNTQIQQGQGIGRFLSLAGILFHELCHALRPQITDVEAVPPDSGPAYMYPECVRYAEAKGTGEATLNAENWNMLALSAYLNEWSWGEGVARPLIPIGGNDDTGDGSSGNQNTGGQSGS